MNKIILIGNLGHDPSLKDVNGKKCVNFTLGTQVGYGENKKTIWFGCTAWEKTAEICKQYLTRGSKIFILGELQPPRVYTDRQGNPSAALGVTIRDMQILSGKSDQAHSQPPSEVKPSSEPPSLDWENVPF